ncbi:MAG: Crp/Fnr family transcriptional regulator, partial [Niameybacter sp.]
YDGYENHESIYCLFEGLCALMSLKDSGKEHIYHYIKAGSIIGFIPAFLAYTNTEDTSSEAYFLIKAKSDCQVFRLDKTLFFELLEFVMLSMANISRDLLKHFYTAQESNAASKIAFTLLSLAEAHEDCRILHKEFNYHELSKYLGIHHVTVTRIMGCLKDEGIIVKVGHSIKIINQEALMDYAQSKKLLQY